MKKEIIYQIIYDDDAVATVQQIESYVFNNPVTSEKLRLINNEGYANVFTDSELNDSDYYLTEIEAINFIDNEKITEDEFLKVCVDFIAQCQKVQRHNPFIAIGEQSVRDKNQRFIIKITDPIYNYFAEMNLQTGNYLNELEKKLIIEMEKESNQ
jgi:hypothetical protein